MIERRSFFYEIIVFHSKIRIDRSGHLSFTPTLTFKTPSFTKRLTNINTLVFIQLLKAVLDICIVM